VPNGKPGDNPVTDVVVWNREVYGADVDALIREIGSFTTDYGAYDPLESVTQLLFDAEADPSCVPELHQRLEALRDELRKDERPRHE
jgi:hypothetical protein